MAVSLTSCHLNVNKQGRRLHLLTSQLLIKSPPRGHWQGLDELGELDASILQGGMRERERERTLERKWPKDKMSILLHTSRPLISSLLFFHDVLEKRGQTLAPTQLLFLPCTWLFPEAEICHLWSLIRWMHLAQCPKSYSTQPSAGYLGQRNVTSFSMTLHCEWTWQIIMLDKV